MTTTVPIASASAYNLSSPMVSQPFSNDRALSMRHPPSISSRSGTSRRHYRSHRSHHGGSSYLPQNEFPNFSHSGDVEIIIAIDGQEKRYMLHRLYLAQSSGFFEASTSGQWSRAQVQDQAQGGETINERGLTAIGEEDEEGSQSGSVRAGSQMPPPGQKMMWRYELDIGGGDHEDEVPMLVQKPYQPTLFGGDHSPRPPPVRNKPPVPSNGFFRSISAMQSAINIPSTAVQPSADSDVIRDYDNMFRIFYNYPPTLDPINITEAYIQCKTLLTLADMYDALDVVGPRIDHHLLQFQSRLWKQIAKYPPSYLKLGYLARSKVIFAEALVHVVGQWPLGRAQLRSLPAAVHDLIEDKVADLDDLKARVEGRLFRLSLTHTDGRRCTPASGYADWAAVSLFRHWLAEATLPPAPSAPKSGSSANTTGGGGHPPHSASTATSHHHHHHQLPSSPGNNNNPLLSSGRVFRTIGAGGTAYLPRDELKRFLKLRPDEYSREALRRFERRMEELKGLARETVRPLMRNCLELEGAGMAGGLGYLTCTRVEEGDYPW